MRPTKPPRVSVVERRGGFYLRIRENGTTREQSAGTTVRRVAERAAVDLERQLARVNGTPWHDVRVAYEEDWLRRQSQSHQANWILAANHLERILAPVLVDDIDGPAVARYTEALRREGKSAATAATYTRYVLACLRWAVAEQLLREAPVVQRRRGKAAKTKAKGRPITEEEYRGCLAVVPQVVGDERADDWRRILELLWLSGLRLGEACTLAWEPRPGSFHVAFIDDVRPLLGLDPERDKAGSDGYAPLTPDCVAWLRQTPPERRRGYVVTPSGQREPRVSHQYAGRVISQICQAAGSPCGAHDFRRAFCSRWARLVVPATLQRLARHESIQTTMAYYVAHAAARVADDAWSAYAADQPDQARRFGVTG